MPEKKFVNYKQYTDLPRLVLYLLTLVWVLISGTREDNDSAAYDVLAPFRSVGYPLYVKITTLFGLIHSHIPVVFVSIVLGIIAINLFVNLLKKHFTLSGWSVFTVTFFLISPYFIYFIANTNMSECIAYPLFIFSIYLLLRAIFEKNKWIAIRYFFVLALLLMVRNQFNFFSLFSFLLILYLLWYSEQKMKTAFLLIGMWVLSILLTAVSDRMYHYVVHQKFVVTPWTNGQLITAMFYSTTLKDTALFEGAYQKGMIDTVVNRLKRDEIYNVKFNSIEYSENTAFKFSKLYVSIQRWTVGYGKDYFAKQGYKTSGRDCMGFWLQFDKLTTDMAYKLIKTHPYNYAKMFFVNFKASFGGLLYMMFYLLLFFISCLLVLRTGNKESITMMIILAINILNTCVVSAVVIPEERYYYYNDILLFSFFSIAVIKFIEERLNIKVNNPAN